MIALIVIHFNIDILKITIANVIIHIMMMVKVLIVSSAIFLVSLAWRKKFIS